MKKFVDFIRITIAGGLLFMLPVAAIILIVLKAVGLLHRFSKPLAEKLPFTHVGGIAIVTIINLILLLLICFLAGLFMRTKFAQRIKKWLEDHVLVYIPGYSYLQAVSAEMLRNDETESWKPASIFVDDNEVICFVIDETENYCSVFLPSAPSPSSGSICVRKKSLITYLPITVVEAKLMIKQFGKGSAITIEKLRSINQAAEIKKPANEIIPK